MTSEDRINAPRARPITLSPWLVVVAALILYGLTLDHWVSLRSLPLMAQVTGWDWHPFPMKWRLEPMEPLFILLTMPLRLAPAAWEPLALNVFTAICAALTLGLLARSVQLLPHDRTREQRQRELGSNAVLTMRTAFLPAFFAVLIMAGHLLFWRHAVVATGEMLNALVFAFIINCILEFRVSHKDGWLLVSALAYGLGTTNNWALIGFFPLYLIAIFRSRGVFGFFNVKFLLRMFLCGLAGLSLYLLLPVMGAASSGRGGFAYLLHQEFGIQLFGLKSIPRWIWMLAALPTVVPLIFASFRWPSFEGELSPTGFMLTRVMFSFLHIAFLALVLVTFFDFKYSPNIRFRDQPIDFMTFYYCGALCLGYFSGYMLLVFGEVRLQSWERRTAPQRLLNHSLYGLVWLVALGAPVVLFWQSYPHIRAGHTSVLRQFADQTLASIPSTNAILLSDDVTRLYLLQADCQRRHIAQDHVLIDTQSFPHREYIGYLVSHYPYMRKLMTTNMSALPPVLGADVLVRFMYQVTQRLPIYYLHPSFGYYFEALYLKPHGLVYEVKPNTNHLERPPLPTAPEVASVDGFWKKLEDGPLKPLPGLAKLDVDADAVSGDYAVALDYWGTELQKANDLKEARDAFAEAIRLNPDNVVAAVNLEYNARLLKGNHKPVDSLDAFYAAVVRLGLSQVLRRDGPVDEPGMDLQIGQAMAHYGELGQAAILFQRRLELLPGDPEAQLAMAKTDVDTHQPDKALALIRQLQKTSKLNPWDLARCEALAYMAGQHYAEAEKVLSDAVKQDPNDENRLETLAEFYLTRGRQFSHERKPGEAGRAFTNALTYVGLQLQLLKSDRLDTVPAYEIPDALLQKAEVEIALDTDEAAVATLSQVMQLQPKNYTALVNRALCEVHIKRYKAARDDFRELGKLLPEHHYLVEFGLAGVAAAQTNNAEEIAHLKLCIETAPESSGEYQKATNRLNMLEHK